MIKAYSIFDAKVHTWSRPFFELTAGAAVRTVSQVLRDPGSMLSAHPADFSLWFCGEFDEDTGQLVPVAPVSMGPVTQWLPQQAPSDTPPLLKAMQGGK